MKKGILILAIASLSLISCGKTTTMSPAVGGATSGTPTTRWTDQNQSPVFCSGTSATSPLGRWALTQTSGSIVRNATLFIQAESTSLSYTCTLGTTSVIATATVPSQYDVAKIYLQGSDSHKAGDPRKLLCEADLTQQSVPYTIKGQCLTIKLNGLHTFRLIGN